MADDPHEARRILLDFMDAAWFHSLACDDPACTCRLDGQRAEQALDALELQHLNQLAPR